MSDNELLSMIAVGSEYCRKLQEICKQATFAMAVEEHLRSPEKHGINIFVDGLTDKESRICLDGLWLGDSSKPAAFIADQIKRVKQIAIDALRTIPEDAAMLGLEPAFTKVEPDDAESAQLQRPNRASKDKATGQQDKKTEVAPVQQENDKTPSTVIIPDYLLKEEYFKNGKTIKKISEEYNTSLHGLYKRIEKIKQQKEDAAKECVSNL